MKRIFQSTGMQLLIAGFLLTACQQGPNSQNASTDNSSLNALSSTDNFSGNLADQPLSFNKLQVCSNKNQNNKSVICQPQTCYQEKYIQTANDKVKKMDILFVVETDVAKNQDKNDIGNSIDSFLNQIPSDIDFHIGIIPGHGSRGKPGKLVKFNNNQFVLKSIQLRHDEIRNSIVNRMVSLDDDVYSKGGREGLYSISKAFDKNNFNLMKSQDFLRDDASLNIIFISQEHDICAKNPNGSGLIAVNNKDEFKAYIQDCAGINTESVYSNIISKINNKPLVISGFINDENANFIHDEKHDVGHGYLELIHKNFGHVANIHNKQINNDMKALGSLCTKRAKFNHEFNINQVNTNDMDELSLTITIDGQSKNCSHDKETHRAILNDDDDDENEVGHHNSEIIVSYCKNLPTPTPTPIVTSTPSPIITATPKPTSVPSQTQIPSATTTPTPTQTPVATITPTPTVIATPSPTPSTTPVATNTPTPSVTVTPSPTSTPSSTPIPTTTPTPLPTTTPVVTPTPTATSTPTATPVPTIDPNASATPTPTATPVPTPIDTTTPTPTSTPVPPSVPIDPITGEPLF